MSGTLSRGKIRPDPSFFAESGPLLYINSYSDSESDELNALFSQVDEETLVVIGQRHNIDALTISRRARNPIQTGRQSCAPNSAERRNRLKFEPYRPGKAQDGRANAHPANCEKSVYAESVQTVTKINLSKKKRFFGW